MKILKHTAAFISEALFSTQKLPYKRNFVRIFRIYDKKHDNHPPLNFDMTGKNRFWLLPPGGFLFRRKVRYETHA